MTNEWSATMIIDEIDRLSVAYDKAKEYISKITLGIDQQVDTWHARQQIIRDQLIQSKSLSSFDFLLPKTQRINELTIQAVEALCRVDLLIEQITRIDLKSHVIPVPTRSFDTDISSNHIRQSTPSIIKQQQPIFNGKSTILMPVLRSKQQQQTSSTRSPQERTSFKPVITQHRSSPNNSENISRPSSIYSQNNNNNQSGTEGLSYPRPSFSTRTPQPDQLTPSYMASSINQTTSNYRLRQQQQQPRKKEKVKLERIPPGTKWKQAKIDIVDSLSGFYVSNLDLKVEEKFLQMQDELHDYYNDLEKSNQLMPLENIAIGDFGAAKYSVDDRWYRARLIMCEDNDKIKIVFIDFGNIEIKSINEFFPLHKLFTELPAQAIACSLSEAFPRVQHDNQPLWSDEIVDIFKDEVLDKIVEVHFAIEEEGTEQWPLHFVRIFLNKQSVTDLPNLRQYIESRPNSFIAEQMAPALSEQEYILFNVPLNEDDSD